jgi:hypothetical protein
LTVPVSEPNPPKHGWFLPDSCHSRINDVVRTTFVVKYLDGVHFLWNKISELALKHKLPTRIWYEARVEGYYGAHIYIEPTFVVPGLGANIDSKKFQIELQISTQLKELLQVLTHPYHELRRRQRKKENNNDLWQWNPSCEEFIPNYLGHMLHYIEGMLMQMRDKQLQGEAK